MTAKNNTKLKFKRNSEAINITFHGHPIKLLQMDLSKHQSCKHIFLNRQSIVIISRIPQF